MAADYTLSVSKITLIKIPSLLYTAMIKLNILENGSAVNWTLLTFNIKKSDNTVLIPVVNPLNKTITISSLSLNTTLTIQATSILPTKTSNIVTVSFNPASAINSSIKYSKAYLSKRINQSLYIIITVKTSDNISISYSTATDLTAF